MSVRVGINGFGRTGRALLRAARRPELGLEVVAVNDLGPPAALARLLARDSVFGRLEVAVALDDDVMVVGDQRIRLLAEAEVKALPWGELGVDVVVEATGKFTARDRAAGHLDAGAPRVVVSAPSKGADATFVMGVNDEQFDPARHVVVSNASCTTNCLAVLAKVLDDAFGIEEGFMTTVHAYTGDQHLVDSVHKDPRRARAAAINIVPTTTGAARATGLVMPSVEVGSTDSPCGSRFLTGRSPTSWPTFDRPPRRTTFGTPTASAAAIGSLVGKLDYSEEPLVSSDIVGSPASCVFDAELTMAQGRMAKVIGWYDNEWGYANRLAELSALVGSASRP